MPNQLRTHRFHLDPAHLCHLGHRQSPQLILSWQEPLSLAHRTDLPIAHFLQLYQEFKKFPVRYKLGKEVRSLPFRIPLRGLTLSQI